MGVGRNSPSMCMMLLHRSWDDVKVDKYRENYLGKDLHWYARVKKSKDADMEAAKEKIRRIKEEEEHAMREALGLAPKCAEKPQGSKRDKHEFS
ncbi:multiple myeloma tumor-associated protein 2 [Tanacetum coccineum]|uniref:Multiple myeloma tumor-associated protein 2 n=1 Tax=Tanacetum coccineum TaxID=301880 RepID=A0ABQ5GF47_9ASTR